ncbi:MAG: LysR family transcriptional regulator, partial [Mesorhizobium sp.]
MQRVTFDLDVLRSFVTGMELGSFAKAADRLGRSTSAVSAQLKKLEEQAATPIFRKVGRGLALTEAGETMLGYARRLLDLNDEAAAAIHDVELE